MPLLDFSESFLSRGKSTSQHWKLIAWKKTHHFFYELRSDVYKHVLVLLVYDHTIGKNQIKWPLMPELFPFTKCFQIKHRLIQLKEWGRSFFVGLVPSHMAQFIQSIPSHTETWGRRAQATATRDYRNSLLIKLPFFQNNKIEVKITKQQGHPTKAKYWS